MRTVIILNIFWEELIYPKWSRKIKLQLIWMEISFESLKIAKTSRTMTKSRASLNIFTLRTQNITYITYNTSKYRKVSLYEGWTKKFTSNEYFLRAVNLPTNMLGFEPTLTVKLQLIWFAIRTKPSKIPKARRYH